MPSEYLTFERSSVLEHGRKTRAWYVRSKSSGAVLGTIGFRPQWRQYVFEPNALTVFNPDCLIEIATFVGLQTKLKRALDAEARRLAPKAPVT